jgi:hypothetical protein
MIKPSHYDDDGYVIQWLRSAMPVEHAGGPLWLALDCQERRVLGDDVDIVIKAPRRNQYTCPYRRIAANSGAAGHGRAGRRAIESVPRAMDMARRCARRAFPSASAASTFPAALSMLPEMHPEAAGGDGPRHLAVCRRSRRRFRRGSARRVERRAEAALQLHGRSAVAGRRAACRCCPRPAIKRTGGKITSFDAGRGCPFQCSFCTIINVQGRKSRRRSVDDIEQIIRRNLAQGINRFFITDDNFARNTDWEIVFDRLIAMREAGES